MVETAAPTAPSKPPPTAQRPMIVFHHRAATVRAIPDGKGWRVEGDDSVLVERIAAALRRPMRTRVSREALDEVSGELQIESWMTTMDPDDPRYAHRVARGRNRVGLDDIDFDEIELKYED
jgi:hypothetical protein